jgi:hypothetical protein
VTHKVVITCLLQHRMRFLINCIALNNERSRGTLYWAARDTTSSRATGAASSAERLAVRQRGAVAEECCEAEMLSTGVLARTCRCVVEGDGVAAQ